jgi:hypothetical protein
LLEPPPNTAKRFLAVLLAAIGVLLMAPAIGIALVDPTGLVQAAWPAAPKLCAKGIQTGHRQAVGFLAAAMHPREAILGNSRAIHGFRQGDVEARLNASVVNLSIPGARFAEIETLLAQARTVDGLKRVWIAMEPGMFLGPAARDKDLGLLVPAPDEPLWRPALRHGVFSSEAAIRTLATLLQPSKCAAAYISPQGFLREEMRTQDRAAFDRAVEGAAAILIREAEATPQDLFLARLARAGAALAAAAEQGVAVVVFTPPMHEALRKRLAGTPWSTANARWTAAMEAAVRRVPGARFHDLRAWSGPPGAPGACPGGGADCLFSDPVHFRPALGAALLDAMLRAP